jgi:hypothetical protein
MTIYENKKGKTFYLNSKEVQLKYHSGVTTIYFYTTDERDTFCNAFPSGYTVVESVTGLPVLKRTAA